MAIYTVLAPGARDGAALPADPMRLVFVREGFSWAALFVAELWLLYRRMWLVFVLYVAVLVAAFLVDRAIGGPFVSVFLVLGHLLFALEGNEIRRWSLAGKGYRIIDVTEGKGLAEAEIRYFTAREAAMAARVDPAPVPPPALPPRPVAPAAPLRPIAPQGPVMPSTEAGDVVGLFPPPPPGGAPPGGGRP
jgi:hypothetical protein